jgi:hypothetical protein
VTATNANGTSTASSASNSVTPTIPKAGYASGGYTNGNLSTVQKLTFSNDSRTTLAATLSASSTDGSAFANSGTAGYAQLGRSTTVNKIAFSNDSISTLGASGSYQSTVDRSGTASNSGTAGYWAGGYNYDVFSSSNAINKITYSNDTRVSVSATMPGGVTDQGSCANSGTAGYFAGGADAGGGNKIQKLTFSGETRSQLGSTLPHSPSGLRGVSNNGVAAFFAGGFAGYYYTGIERITYSTDTFTSQVAYLNTGSTSMAGFAESGTAGYFAGGGASGGSGITSIIQKMAFSNNTVSTLSATMPANTYQASGMANSGTL